MRFGAGPVEGGWNVWDGARNVWRGGCCSQAEAEQRALELNLAYDQYGPRPERHRRQVEPPVPVDAWAPAGEVRGWVRERGRWIAAVSDGTGRVRWVDGTQLRPRAG